MANKKQVRDAVAKQIMMIEAGGLKLKNSDVPLTLNTIPDTILTKWHEKLAEKKISRTSIYKTIECMAWYMWGMDSAVMDNHLKNIHEYVYSKLDK